MTLKAIFSTLSICLVSAMLMSQDLSIPFNSVYDEQNPVLSRDGNTLYFTRANHPSNIGGRKDRGDIWISDKTGNTWSEPRNAGPLLNSADYNGVIGFSADGEIMYLYGHYTKDGSRAKTQGISQSLKTSRGWSTPGRVQIEYFLNKSEFNGINISSDGKILLLSMESFGSFGAEDLYVSFLRPDGTWSQPSNLGPIVNTSFQEMTPFLGEDNITLYFASNGFKSHGSRDIFMTRRLDDSWKNWLPPVNLGNSVNTEGMELSFQPLDDKMAMYVTTLNSDGYGDIRISAVNMEEITKLAPQDVYTSGKDIQIVDLRQVNELKESDFEVTLFGMVTDAGTGLPIPATISLTDPEGSEIKMSSDRETGKYSMGLPSSETYKVVIESPGYVGQAETLDLFTLELSAIEMDFNLYPAEVGTTINLDHVHFHRGTAKLLETSNDELDLVAKLLVENKKMEIALAGHTDNQGSSRLNLILSENRVKMVKEYLVSKGVEPERVSGKGYGSAHPIASNKSEETRKFNRRVEFTIVKM